MHIGSHRGIAARADTTAVDAGTPVTYTIAIINQLRANYSIATGSADGGVLSHTAAHTARI